MKKGVAISIISILTVLAIALCILFVSSSKTIDTLNASISEKEKQIETISADAADKADQIEALNADVADKANQIDTLNADVAEKADQISTLTADATDKAEQIKALNADVVDKASKIEALSADVESQAEQISELKANAIEKASQIDLLNANISEKTSQIETLNADITDKATKIEKCTPKARASLQKKRSAARRYKQDKIIIVLCLFLFVQGDPLLFFCRRSAIMNPIIGGERGNGEKHYQKYSDCLADFGRCLRVEHDLPAAGCDGAYYDGFCLCRLYHIPSDRRVPLRYPVCCYRHVCHQFCFYIFLLFIRLYHTHQRHFRRDHAGGRRHDRDADDENQDV